MVKSKKKIFLNISILLTCMTTAIVPLSSCNNSISFDSVENDNQNKIHGKISSNIIEKINEANKLEPYKEIKWNNFNDVTPSKEDFLATLDINDEKYKNDFKMERIIYDISNFLLNIYQSANNELDVTLISDFNSTLTTNHSLNFDGLNFKIEIKNRANKKKEYFIHKNKISINANETDVIDVTIPKTTLAFDVNKNNFLQPMFNKVEFNYLNNKSKSFDLNSFIFLDKKMSYATPFRINGIFKIDEDHINETKFDLNLLDEKTIKENIEKDIANKINLPIKFINNISQLINILNNNEPIDEFLTKFIKPVTEILIDMNLISETHKKVIIDLLDKNKSIPEIISTNLKEISNILVSSLPIEGMDSSLIEMLLAPIGPNMTQEDKNTFIALAKKVITDSSKHHIIDKIANALFGKNNIYEFISIIVNDTIPNNQNGQQLPSLVDSLISFIKFVFSKDSQIGKFKTILQIFTEQKDLLLNLLTSLLNTVGLSGVSSIVESIIKANSFNYENIKIVIRDLLKPLGDYLSNESNYKITKEFVKSDKQNIPFLYDKENKKVSFNYSVKMTFNKEHKVDLKPLYKLLNGAIFNINNNKIPFLAISAFLPQYFTLGQNDNISINFYSNGDYISLNPIKISDESGYYFNCDIPYKANIVFNMNEMFLSLFKQKRKNSADWKLIESTLSTLLMIDYNFFGTISISDKKFINVNYVEPYPNINKSFKWNDLTQDQIKSIKTKYIELKESFAYDVKDSKGVVVKVFGKKPHLIIDEAKQKELMKLLFTFGSEIESLPNNEKPIVFINPHIDGAIKTSIPLIFNIEIPISLFEVNVYFPNGKIIDNNNSDKNNNRYVYNNYFKKTISLT